MRTVPGTSKILAVETSVPGMYRTFGIGPRRCYVLRHLPSGAAVCSLDCRDDAVTVAKELFERIPLAQWQTASFDTLAEIIEPHRGWFLLRLRALYESGRNSR